MTLDHIDTAGRRSSSELGTEAREPSLDRRQVLGGLAASAGWVGLSGLAPTAACAQTTAAPGSLRSGDFQSFRQAVARWSQVGGTLIVTADHVETAPVTMLCLPGLSYHLTSEGPRTISYAGPHYHWFFCIYSEGRNPFVIDGDLTLDGRSNCSLPLFVRFEHVSGDARRNFTVDGLTCQNARMRSGVSRVDGSPTNTYGATGMLYAGGFDRLNLRRVRALNVGRDAGAGRAGSQGCVGIGVTAGVGTASARHVEIADFEVARIDSDDPPGSAARSDMDGVLVFQTAEAEGSRPVIERGTIREAAGRAVKVFAPGGGGMTRDLVVYRSVHGVTGGSNDIAHQHGDGLIENITFHYSGHAHSQPTLPIGFSAGHLRAPGFPFTAGVVRNVRINDSTGRPKRAIATLFFNLRDPTPRRYVLADIVDTGTADHLFLPGALGTDADARIEIDNVTVRLNIGLFATEDRDPRLRVMARRLSNLGPRSVPFQVTYNGRGVPRDFGPALVTDGSVRGIDR